MLTSRSRAPSTTGGSTNYCGARSSRSQRPTSIVRIQSKVAPLRSVLLDPAVNDIPQSKTRSDLINKIKKLGLPTGPNTDPQLSLSDSNEFHDLAHEKRTSLLASGSTIKEALNLADDKLIKHNFFTDKFDQTAWNDFDAIPRSCSMYGLNDHGGSRKRLMFARRQTDREKAATLMEDAIAKMPFVDTRRLKLISDISIENS